MGFLYLHIKLLILPCVDLHLFSHKFVAPCRLRNSLSFLSRKLGQFGFKVFMYLNKPHIIIIMVFGVYDSPLVFLVSATNLEKVLLNNFLS